MIEVRTKRRNQPPPPWFVVEALTEPNRDPARQWLRLGSGEVWPRAVEVRDTSLVVWSSLWAARPDARIRFDLAPDGGGGTDLRFTLLLEEPLPDDDAIEAMRYRLSKLINADLRYSFGQ